jgi:hypothetical protein
MVGDGFGGGLEVLFVSDGLWFLLQEMYTSTMRKIVAEYINA